MRLSHLLTNMHVYLSTSVSEHSACKTLKEIQLNRKVALNKKVKYTLSTSHERRGENPL